MAEVDTSSYKLPVVPSPLDTVGKLQTLQSNDLGIQKQKLDQANQALGYMTRAMASIGPDGTKEDYAAVGQNAVKMGLVPAPMLDTYIQRLNAAKSPKDFFNEVMAAAATHSEVINWHLGQPGYINNGQTIQPVRTPLKAGAGAPVSTGLPVQQQIPPTAGAVVPEGPNAGQPTYVGPQAPVAAPGAVTAPPGLPVVPLPRPDVRVGPPALPKDQGKLPVTGLPPGVAEAEVAAGAPSGSALAQARIAGNNFQREVFPLAKAIPGLEALGTKGTGPGTDALNNIKSFLLSNLPGVTEKDLADVKTYDQVKKYLTDFVNQTGTTGTNDKLAAAFAGNPSVGISNAAAQDVAKAALALRRMQHAQYLEFENSKLPASQFSKWMARRGTEIDPRAFGVDMMNDEAKAKLKEQLGKNKVERERFEASLKLAHDLGFIKPQ